MKEIVVKCSYRRRYVMRRDEMYNVLLEEALASCRYQLFAEQADKEGLHYLAKIFRETSVNELSHVRELMNILELVQDTKVNLEVAIQNEKLESTTTYPSLQELAIADNELNTARFFQQLSKIEEQHRKRFEQLLDLLQEGNLYRREEPILWKCRTCGYIHNGTEPPKKCPGCQSTYQCFEPEDFSV